MFPRRNLLPRGNVVRRGNRFPPSHEVYNVISLLDVICVSTCKPCPERVSRMWGMLEAS